MANYAAEMLRKSFSNKDAKVAFLNASKWVATNLIHDEVVRGSTMCKYEKGYDEKTCKYIIIVVVYVSLNEQQAREDHCAICKEVHHSFFINENVNCNECKLKAYQSRVDNRLQYLKEHLKERIVVDVKKHKVVAEGDSYLDQE